VKPNNFNVRLNHLSWIENGEGPTNMEEQLPDTQFFNVRVVDEHFVDIINFLSTGIAPKAYMM